MEIFVDDEAKLTLHGLVQHYIMLNEDEKNRKLNDLLDALDFNQVCALLLHHQQWVDSGLQILDHLLMTSKNLQFRRKQVVHGLHVEKVFKKSIALMS